MPSDLPMCPSGSGGVDELRPPYEGLWEVTTRHGTRIVLDFISGRVLRAHESGVNRWSTDGRWWRLGASIAVVPIEDGVRWLHEAGRPGIAVGHAFRYSTPVSTPVSSEVTSIRPVQGEEGLVMVEGFGVMTVHSEMECIGRAYGCWVHRPGTHPLRDATVVFDPACAQRRCRHGVLHPDPDDAMYRSRGATNRSGWVNKLLAHECCMGGCCQALPAETCEPHGPNGVWTLGTASGSFHLLYRRDRSIGFRRISVTGTEDGGWFGTVSLDDFGRRTDEPARVGRRARSFVMGADEWVEASVVEEVAAYGDLPLQRFNGLVEVLERRVRDHDR